MEQKKRAISSGAHGSSEASYILGNKQRRFRWQICEFILGNAESKAMISRERKVNAKSVSESLWNLKVCYLTLDTYTI